MNNKLKMCNNCKIKLIVLDTRDTKYKHGIKSIRRRRECPQCKERITTYEFVTDDLLELSRDLDSFKRLKEAVLSFSRFGQRIIDEATK